MPGTTQPVPASAACWSTSRGAQRQLPATARWRSVPRSPTVSSIRGQRPRRARRTSRTATGRSRAPRARESCMRDAVDGVGREAGAEPVAQERVERAEPQRAGVARGLHRSSVLQHPGQLRGREVGVDRQPAARLDLVLVRRSAGRAPAGERLSCHTTIGDSGSPVSASQAITDSPWWSSPHATTSPGRVGEHLGDRVDDARRARPRRPARPSPGAGCWLTLSRRARRERLQLRVDEHRLHAGRPDVEPEQQPGHSPRAGADQPRSNIRRRS